MRVFDHIARFSDHYLVAVALLLIAIVLANRSREVIAAVVSVLAVIFVIFFDSINEYLKNIGRDSWGEIHNLSLPEVWVFLQTINTLLSPLSARHAAFVLFVAMLIASAVYLALRKLIPSRQVRYAVGAAVVGTVLLFPINDQARRIGKSFTTSQDLYLKIRENFGHSSRDQQTAIRDLKTVVFIGESTSTLNMNLYGYLRNNTPRLNKFHASHQDFFLFRNAYSTHVHTSPSLLESLSMAVQADELFKPIFDRQRAPIAKILGSGGVPTHLISNQAETGSWSLALKILFEGIASKTHSVDTRFAGNLDYRLPRPNEAAFFRENLPTALESKGPGVIFLHSYVPHYYYWDHIPMDRQKRVDDLISTQNSLDITGRFNVDWALRSVGRVERVDSGIRFLDHILAEVLTMVEFAVAPTVLLYFADHGDAPYAGVSHDVARYQYEMSRVPLALYFNKSAARKYPELLDRYRKRSQSNEIVLLSQIAPTILDLTNLKTNYEIEPLIGEPRDADLAWPINVREVAGSVQFVDLNPNTTKISAANTAGQAAYLSGVANELSGRGVQLCYGKSDTLGTILRGRLALGCTHTRLHRTNDGVLSLGISKGVSPGISDPRVFKWLVNGQSNLAWFSVPASAVTTDCFAKQEFVRSTSRKNGSMLVDVSMPTSDNWEDFIPCLEMLVKQNIQVSLQMSELFSQCRLIDCEAKLERIRSLIARLPSIQISVPFESFSQNASRINSLGSASLNLTEVAVTDVRKKWPSNVRRLSVLPTRDPNLAPMSR